MKEATNAESEWVGKTETLNKFSSSDFFPLTNPEEKLRHHAGCLGL